jgi:SAM-dependent methyltransferase
VASIVARDPQLQLDNSETNHKEQSLNNFIKNNRRLLEVDLLKSRQRYLFSPVYYAQDKITVPLLNKFVFGKLIDIGSGDTPYRERLEGRVDCYDTLDLYPRTENVKFVGSVENMDMILDNQYDSAICLEVLEHIPRPMEGVREIHRVLRPGGILVLSVPHLSRIHDAPNDFFRFTKYGLQYLLEDAGFHITQIKVRGGLFTFLGHQWSTFILGLVWKVPILKQIVWFVNSWLVSRLFYYLDQVVDQTGTFPQGYTVVAEKPQFEHGK